MPGRVYHMFNETAVFSVSCLKVPHWNVNVVILMKISSAAALEVVKMTTSSAASDENFIKMMTFPFQCILQTIFGVENVRILIVVSHCLWLKTKPQHMLLSVQCFCLFEKSFLYIKTWYKPGLDNSRKTIQRQCKVANRQEGVHWFWQMLYVLYKWCNSVCLHTTVRCVPGWTGGGDRMYFLSLKHRVLIVGEYNKNLPRILIVIILDAKVLSLPDLTLGDNGPYWWHRLFEIITCIQMILKILTHALNTVVKHTCNCC